jgi:hypothetical protein
VQGIPVSVQSGLQQGFGVVNGVEILLAEPAYSLRFMGGKRGGLFLVNLK